MTPSPIGIRSTPGPTKICYDCDHELYPKGKIIFDDPLVKQDSKGRWHCSDCQETERRKNLVKIYGPNHTNTRPFIEHEDKIIRKWNQGACSIDNSITQGRWKHPQTKVTYDDIGKIYWIICDDNEGNREFFKKLQNELMVLLEQESILIYYSNVSMI